MSEEGDDDPGASPMFPTLLQPQEQRVDALIAELREAGFSGEAISRIAAARVGGALDRPAARVRRTTA